MQIYLINRMFASLASKVSDFTRELYGNVPLEAEEPEDLPEGEVDVLVVGQAHLRSDGSGVRHGFEVLEPAFERGRPRTLLYVLPGLRQSGLYDRDLQALRGLSKSASCYVLEFPILDELGVKDAALRAKHRFKAATIGEVVGLLDP